MTMYSYTKDQIRAGNTNLLTLANALDRRTEILIAGKMPVVPYNQLILFHRCGTPGCALGLWEFIHKRGHGRSQGYMSSVWWAEFALNNDEYDMLFDTCGCGDAADEKAAAAYIRMFVDNRVDYLRVLDEYGGGFQPEFTPDG
jgi:hypothetical protein